jgi:hypothetical protein
MGLTRVLSDLALLSYSWLMLMAVCVCQIVPAYSRMGLTRVLSDLALMSCGQLVIFLVMNDRAFLFFLVVDSMRDFCNVDTKALSTLD